jgi:hypothetical protein
MEPSYVLDRAKLPDRSAQGNQKKRKNVSATTADSSSALHEDRQPGGGNSSSHGGHSPGPVAKRLQRTKEEKRAANKRYAQTMRSRTAELDAMYAPIDTKYNTFTGSRPKKPSKETKELIIFEKSLHESTKRAQLAPPTRCVVDQEVLNAITKCSSANRVRIEIEKRMISTDTPELMLVPATTLTNGMAEQLLPSMLRKRFNAIYQPAAKNFKPTWSISNQLKKMKGQNGDAHQPASTRPGQASTKPIKYQLVERAFSDLNDTPRDIDYGLNVLDIANTTSRTFTPDEVRDVDILRIIHDKQSRQPSYNRDAAMTQTRQLHGLSVTLPPEWMILSMGGAVSPWHADSAGYCTFVVGIEGRKVWHLVKGDWSETKDEFGVYGTHHNKWSAGVFPVLIDPGCSL